MHIRALMMGACFAAIASPSLAAAEIFRCTAASGAITYQEIPCPASAPGRATDIPAAYPGINSAERDRLLQREALLEARLLKRAEIDAAERIARDDRIARERELQPQIQPTAPAVLLVRPLRPPRPFRAYRRPYPTS